MTVPRGSVVKSSTQVIYNAPHAMLVPHHCNKYIEGQGFYCTGGSGCEPITK